MKAFVFIAVFLLGTSFFALGASDKFSLEGRCKGSEGRYVRDGRDGQDIKPSLNAIASYAGVKLRVYSCFRSQDRQNAILQKRGCAPFGNANCSQSVARVSQHTKSIAADLHKFADFKTQCRAIAAGRNPTQGRGGVGTYPRGDGHFDLGSMRSWNRCKGIIKSGGSSPATPAGDRYRASKASGGGSGRCHPTPSFPNCCGPIRASRGLCSL